jgi:hypothetical protein
MLHPDRSNSLTPPSGDGQPSLPACVSAIRDLTLTSRNDALRREVLKAQFEQVPVLSSEGVSYVVRYFDGELYRVNRMDVEEVLPWCGPDPVTDIELPSCNTPDGIARNEVREARAEGSSVGWEDLLPPDTGPELPVVPAPSSRVGKQSGSSSTPARTLGEWKNVKGALEPPKTIVPMMAAHGRMLLLAAREKVGKSTLCAWLLAMLSTGQDLFGQKIAPQKLLWISFEESPDQVVPRLLAMGASEDLVTYIDGWEMVASNTMPEVYRIIREHSSALVVIDSLSRMATRGGDVRNENDSSDWVPIFEGLKAAATASRSAVVLLHHTSKVTNEPRGSTMIASAVDDVAIMSRVGHDKQTLRIKVEGRTFKDTFALRQTEDGMGFSEVPLISKRALSSEELHSLVIETLLAAPGISGTALKAKLRKKKSLVDAAVNELVSIGTLERIGAGPKSGLRVVSERPIVAGAVDTKLAA